MTGTEGDFVIDSQGQRRRRSFHQAISEVIQDRRTQLSPGRLFIEPPDFAKGRDEQVLLKMQRDAVVFKAMTMRRHRAAGTEVFFVADDKIDRPLIPYFEALTRRIPNFSQSRLALTTAIFEGRGWLKMMGRQRKFRISPDVEQREWWYPGHLGHIGADAIKREWEVLPEVDPDGKSHERRKYYWATYDDENQAWLRVEDEQEKHYIKVVYHDDAYSLGYGRGLIDAIYFYWYNKTHLFQQLLQAADRFGTPWIIAKIIGQLSGVDGGEGIDDPEQHAADLIAALEKMRSANILIVDGEHDEISTLDFDGRGAEGMIRLLDYCDKGIVEALLGSSMPTGGGQSGSFARAQVEQESTNNMLSMDTKILEEALQDMVWLMWDLNLPNFSQIQAPGGQFLSTLNPPRIKIRTSEETTLEKQDRVRLALEMLDRGLPFLKGEFYDLIDFTQPDEDDEDILQPPGAGGGVAGVPGIGGSSLDVFGQPTPGANEGLPGDGLQMSEIPSIGNGVLSYVKEHADMLDR